MAEEKPPRFRADGQLDGRGHSEASKANRFTTGDGRPRPGRRKGARDERTMILGIRDMPVVVTGANGRKRKLNTPEAILLKLRQKALGGDIKAAAFLMARLDRYEPPSTNPDHTRGLLEEDETILAAARGRGVLSLDDEEGGEA